MPERLNIARINAKTRELDLAGAKVHHLPDWSGYDDPRKLEVIKSIAEQRGRDPRIRKMVAKIIKKSGAAPRNFKKQAAALLKWVQDPKNIYYLNEPGEQLQDPIYTIKHGYGDCDDQVIVLCSFFEAIRLPWKLVISGRTRDTKRKVRHIQGGPYPPNTGWSHIYCMVGTPAFVPKQWYFCEPTVQGVPLGWDVVSGDKKFIPEMETPPAGPPRIMRSPKARRGHRARRLPTRQRRSPAYAESYGNISSSVGSAIAEELDTQAGSNGLIRLAAAILTGVAVSVTTQVALDWYRGEGASKGQDPGYRRAGRFFRKLMGKSA